MAVNSLTIIERKGLETFFFLVTTIMYYHSTLIHINWEFYNIFIFISRLPTVVSAETK